MAKLCPLKFTDSFDPDRGITCDESKCAWWDDDAYECAVLAIAQSVLRFKRGGS